MIEELTRDEHTARAARAQNNAVLPVTVITPSRGWAALRLGEVKEYAELLYFLTWRDVKVRYKQAVLGVAWAIIQPVVTMVIFTVIFGNFAKIPSDGVPYPLFSMAALLPWTLFSGSLQRAGTSLVTNANLVTKVYFPRLVVPTSAVMAGLVDFALSSVVMLGLMVWYALFTSWTPHLGWPLLTLPFFVAFAALASIAVGLWLSALNVQYRDVQHTIPFLVQVWMYASPVVYSSNIIPSGPMRVLYGLNPMAGVIYGFRWALLGGPPPDGLMAMSIGVVAALLVGGLYYFKRMERTFADVV